MLVFGFGLSLALNLLATLLHVMAISLTSFRLYYRKRIERLWWDDYTAGISALINFGFIPFLWFSYAPPDSLLIVQSSVVVQYWVSNVLFFVADWLARISIALAIARIFPEGDTTRRFAMGLALLFAALSITMIVQFSVVCGRQSPIVGPVYVWTQSLRFVVTIASPVSDALLVGTPLYKLWRVRLPRRQRRLILAGFAASILTSAATIGCVVFSFAPPSWDPARQHLRVLLRYFEVAISLIACNLLVVMTYIHTVLRVRADQHLTISTRPETTETTRNTEPVSHSNQMPSSVLSTLVLTEITDAYVHNSNNYTAESSKATSSSPPSTDYSNSA